MRELLVTVDDQLSMFQGFVAPGSHRDASRGSTRIVIPAQGESLRMTRFAKLDRTTHARASSSEERPVREVMGVQGETMAPQ